MMNFREHLITSLDKKSYDDKIKSLMNHGYSQLEAKIKLRKAEAHLKNIVAFDHIKTLYIASL
jgi:hypothetical protein